MKNLFTKRSNCRRQPRRKRSYCLWTTQNRKLPRHTFTIRYESVKNVRIAHYLLPDHRIDFDTSFRFNTLANKTKNENLYEEYFMTVPNKGFMLLKEYGKPFSLTNRGKEITNAMRQTVFFPVLLMWTGMSTPVIVILRQPYSLWSWWSEHVLFSVDADDSCWSGIINKEQTTEITSSYLSYVFLPREDKLFFLYNEFFRNSNQYSNTTVLDQKGNTIEEGVVYWKMKNNLVFQKQGKFPPTS
jgi:hypothetical protein